MKLSKQLSIAALMYGAAMLTRKGAASGWVAATGDEPPPDQPDPDTDMDDALTWAIVSGAAVGIARMVLRRALPYQAADSDRSNQDQGV